jgi:hypothetical protein
MLPLLVLLGVLPQGAQPTPAVTPPLLGGRVTSSVPGASEVLEAGRLTPAQRAKSSLPPRPEVTCPIQTVTSRAVDPGIVKPSGPVPDLIVRNELAPCLK